MLQDQPKANPGFDQFAAVVQMVEHFNGPESGRPMRNGTRAWSSRFAASAAHELSQQPLNDRLRTARRLPGDSP
jgi:hypothetical protein